MIHIVKEQTVIDSHKPHLATKEAGLGLWTDQARLWGGGGAKRDRTADLLRARQALSQLSYGPTDHRKTMNFAKGEIGGSGQI